MVFWSSMAVIRVSRSSLEASVEIIVFPCARFAELVDLHRQRQADCRELIGEMFLDDVEEGVTRSLSNLRRPPHGDLEVSVQKGGVGPAVGDTVFVAPQRAHADTAERENPLLAVALGVQAVSQLVAQLTDASFSGKVGAVFECQVGHGYLLIAHSHGQR